ncbi:MAG: phosphocholine cytidylyltransferase family protein [Omnitrophica bacterium]|nr:phosphocholine cytidylyltransferase family protein [Candidatus Omnitrophota bacterium]
MKAIILAAGRGKRLKDFTEDKPKCLNRIGGRTIFDRQITVLRSCGIDEIIVVTGYRAEMLKKPGVKTIFNPKWHNSNMVVSLLSAEKEFGEPAIVSYSDIVYEKSAIRGLVEEKEEAVVAYDLDWEALWRARFTDPLEDAESFKIGSDRRIKEIGRKANSLFDIQGQYMGLMRFSPLAFSWILEITRKETPDCLNRMDMTTLLQTTIQGGYPVYGMPVKGGWCEIDTARDLKLAERLCAENKLGITVG